MKQGVLSPAIPKGSDNMILNKFEDADILDSLRQIMELHTKHYKEDFGLDSHTRRRSSGFSDAAILCMILMSRPKSSL